MMPTFGSLFAGIGGFDLGLERSGWTPAWQVERDPFCQRVLAHHWPDVRRHDDVRTFPPAGDWSVDLICGGFPCQPVSIAGKRRGQDDARWLWPEFARIIRALRPRYVLVENVPGLLGRGFGDVLGDLAAEGYDAEWRVLGACEFGAPHARDRMFLAADSHARIAGLFDAHPTRHEHWQTSSHWTRWEDVERWFRASVPDGHGLQDRPTSTGMDDGVSTRLDGYGNAIVPQVAEWIGRRLMRAYEENP